MIKRRKPLFPGDKPPSHFEIGSPESVPSAPAGYVPLQYTISVLANRAESKFPEGSSPPDWCTGYFFNQGPKVIAAHFAKDQLRNHIWVGCFLLSDGTTKPIAGNAWRGVTENQIIDGKLTGFDGEPQYVYVKEDILADTWIDKPLDIAEQSGFSGLDGLFISQEIWLALDAIKHWQITEDNPPITKKFRGWLEDEAGKRGFELSGKTLDTLTKILRPGEKKGGRPAKTKKSADPKN